MGKHWVRVFESEYEVKTEMARQLLEENGIEAVIINKRDRAYGFGEYELFVKRDMVIKTKQLLKEL